jgi:hypothetical protein
MQIETPMCPDFSSNEDIVDPQKDAEGPDDKAELDWLLSHRMREPVLWPRVFPGL